MSESRTPLVTVLVPSYNHAPYVADTLRSIWAQTYPHVQVVVVDDASSDGSGELLGALEAEGPMRLLRNERNLGLNASIERGLAAAEGEYLAILASDDLILPEKLARQVAYLERTGMDGVFSSGYLLMPDGSRAAMRLDRLARMFEDGRIVRHMQTSDTYGPLLQGGLFRTALFRALAPLRHRFRSDDWAMTATMVAEHRVGFLDELLFVYRQHATNTYRDYWRTLPMRVEVICGVTPRELRREALANLLASLGDSLAADGAGADARAFRRAALALHPSGRRVRGRVETRVRAALAPLVRTVRGATAGKGRS